MISAPDASKAAFISRLSRYLPVPTINRLENVLPAIVEKSVLIHGIPSLFSVGYGQARVAPNEDELTGE